ncbi:MAG: hypothetical protein HQM08_23855 [Candidatus Riflebacteria bacterium]|nr:hypothetical protein [Candidatus Riflebacteria bacterium]
MKLKNIRLLALAAVFAIWQFLSGPLIAADPTDSYLKELKTNHPSQGKIINDQIFEILLKVPTNEFLDLVWPFLNPPSMGFKWVETQSELVDYFSKNTYSDYLKEELKYVDFTGKLKESFKSPVPIYNKARIIQVGGGLVMFHQHIFAEGYYRSKFDGNTSNTDNFVWLTKNQPWFEWNRKSYSLRKGQTIKTLFTCCQNQTGDLILYRGAHPEEFDRFQQSKSSGKLVEIKNPDLASTSALPKCPNVFFMTPDKLKAFGWNKGIVEKVRIPASVWQKWTDESGLYAGIEYNYLEIAFYKNPAKAFLLNNIEKVNEDEMKSLKKEYDALNPPDSGKNNVDNPDAH